MASQVDVRAYASPTMVLLALDWADADQHADFLGFAIKRTPGFFHQAESWLPNRIDFKPPAKEAVDHPSITAPRRTTSIK